MRTCVQRRQHRRAGADRLAGGAVGDPQQQASRRAARSGRAGAPRRRSQIRIRPALGISVIRSSAVAAEQQAARRSRPGAAAGRRTRSGTCRCRPPPVGASPCSRSPAATSGLREGHRLDPLRVVDAGQRRHDHPRRVAVVEREVLAVDLQREERAASSATAPGLSVAWLNAPPSWSDSTRTSASPSIPAIAASSESRTPVQSCHVVQPSTQAIGSRSVCWVHRQQVVAARG